MPHTHTCMFGYIDVCICNEKYAIQQPPVLYRYANNMTEMQSPDVVSSCNDVSGNRFAYNLNIRHLLYDGHRHSNKIWGTPRVLTCMCKKITPICCGAGAGYWVLGITQSSCLLLYVVAVGCYLVIFVFFSSLFENLVIFVHLLKSVILCWQ